MPGPGPALRFSPTGEGCPQPPPEERRELGWKTVGLLASCRVMAPTPGALSTQSHSPVIVWAPLSCMCPWQPSVTLEKSTYWWSRQCPCILSTRWVGRRFLVPEGVTQLWLSRMTRYIAAKGTGPRCITGCEVKQKPLRAVFLVFPGILHHEISLACYPGDHQSSTARPSTARPSIARPLMLIVA